MITETSFTVLTYNLRCKPKKYSDRGEHYVLKRLPRIVERVKAVDPDIFAAQEVQHFHLSALKQALLDKYDFVFRYRRHTTLFYHRPESCPIFYKKDKFELIDSGHFWLSKTPDVESKMDGAGQHRICTWARLKVKASGKEFIYYNTHLDFGEAQIKSYPVILSRVAEGAPVILGGDFNFGSDSPGYELFTKHFSDSCDLSEQDKITCTYHDYHPATVSAKDHIDFLFYRGGITPTSYQLITNDEDIWGEGKFASDHYPVLVRFSI